MWDLEARQGRADKISGEEPRPEERLSGEKVKSPFPRLCSFKGQLRSRACLELCLFPVTEQSQQHSKECEINLHPQEGL